MARFQLTFGLSKTKDIQNSLHPLQSITGEKENLTNVSAVFSPDTSLNLPGTPSGKSGIRPLTQAYQTAHAEYEVTALICMNRVLVHRTLRVTASRDGMGT